MADDFDLIEHRRWLEDGPKQVAVVLAARSALRALPANATLLKSGLFLIDDAPHIIVSQFLAVAATWAVGTWRPHQIDRITEEAFSRAANAVDSFYLVDTEVSIYLGHALHVTMHAARTANSEPGSLNLTESATLAAVGMGSTDTIEVFLRDASMADKNAIIDGTPPEVLALQPLWLRGPPEEVLEFWAEMKTALLDQAPHWSAWTDWYEDRLWGSERSRPVIPKLEAARVQEPTQEQWADGPYFINSLLLKIEARYRTPQVDPDEVPAQSPEGGRFAVVGHRVTVADLRDQDEVSTDPHAAELHGEVGRLLSALKDKLDETATKPTNAPNALLELARRLSAALGTAPEKVGVVALIAGLVELEEELAADDRVQADTSDMEGPALPIDTRKAANALQRMLAIYVRTDAFLATMEHRAHDRDPAPVDVAAVEATVEDAIVLDAADPEVGPFIERAGKGGKATVLYGGTSRNFGRALLKIGAAVAVLGVAEAAMMPHIVKLLKRRRESLRVIFKDDPEIMKLIDRVVDPLDRLYPDG